MPLCLMVMCVVPSLLSIANQAAKKMPPFPERRKAEGISVYAEGTWLARVWALACLVEL